MVARLTLGLHIPSIGFGQIRWAIAVPLAIVWALIIFNLDRFLTSTMTSTRNPWRLLGLAFPRVVMAALIGAGLGFLWFNAPPAMVFMGDTGSLSIGGALGAVAVITKHEIVLAIVGGLFVLETVSVIVQVLSFKLTGKRVFRMAPLHHHFEKKGWAEPTIVIRFWIIALILAIAGLSTLKLR